MLLIATVIVNSLLILTTLVPVTFLMLLAVLFKSIDKFRRKLL